MTRVLTSIALLLISGCEILTPDDQLTPGAIRLAYVHNPDATSDTFDLGQIKNTRSYDFYLTNTGEAALHDITITGANNKVRIEPAQIRLLASEKEGNSRQNLRITIVHGSSITGVGFAETLAMGLNELHLSLTAKTTTDNGDTLSIEQSAVLKVDAHLVNINVLDSQGATVDLRDTGEVRTPIWHRRWYDVANGPVSVINTGNVQLQMQILKQDATTSPVTYEETNLALAPQEEITVDRLDHRIFFRIDGGQTISDFETLPIQQDGFIYFVCAP